MKVRVPLLIALSLVVFAVGPGGSSAAVLSGSIEYAKSGGFAGIGESMRIGRDARGKIARRTFELSSRDGRRLATAIRRADLARVRSPKAGACCDFFQYEIRYCSWTLRWDAAGADELPVRVRELSALLAELYARHAGA